MTHALIVGPRGAGKSTLISRVTAALGHPAAGYETRKEVSLTDPARGAPVYFYELGQPRLRTEDNRLAFCGAAGPRADGTAFERMIPALERAARSRGIIVLDEVGFLETVSPRFCAAVLALLDGDVPVIAAVKDRDIPFLRAVRGHPNCRCFFLTPENRDALYPEVLSHMERQLAGTGR